jgi:hypothetical protein
LEKFVLHESKIFSKNGADCAPSTLEKNILLWIAVVGIALVLFGIERLIGWPDWLTVNSHRGGIGF